MNYYIIVIIIIIIIIIIQLLLTISYLAVCSNHVELKNGVMTTPKRRFFSVCFFFL